MSEALSERDREQDTFRAGHGPGHTIFSLGLMQVMGADPLFAVSNWAVASKLFGVNEPLFCRLQKLCTNLYHVFNFFMQLFIEVVREKCKTDNFSNGKKRHDCFNKYKGRNGESF